MTLRAIVTMALVLCVADAHAESLKDQSQKMRSWSATAHMVAQAWLAHQMPDGYARRTLRAAQDAVQRTARDLARNARADAARAPLRARVVTLGDALDAARTAVARDDRAAMPSVIDRLEAAAQALAGLP